LSSKAKRTSRTSSASNDPPRTARFVGWSVTRIRPAGYRAILQIGHKRPQYAGRVGRKGRPVRGSYERGPRSANAAQPQSPRRACGAAGVAALMPSERSTPTRRRPRLRRDAAGGCAGRSVVPRWRGWRRRLCLSLGVAARGREICVAFVNCISAMG
jgi:hypothetical protein